VATPTLFIWGSADQALGETAAKATARWVNSTYQFEIFDNVSHWLPEEAPERIAKLLLAHCAKFPA
jgi:pimeloyl-ACP methyl ester carboxylesterase